MSQSTTSFHPITKSFHWLVVAMLLVQFSVGWLMPGIRRSTSPSTFVSFHMSFGIVILGVMLLRLVWRLIYPVPDLEDNLPIWQKWAARSVQYLLYATVIALPLTGWWLTSTHGWGVNVFGIFSLPPLVSTSATEQLADLAHGTAITIACILIGAHVLAALYHYFVLKDNVLQHMLPGSSS